MVVNMFYDDLTMLPSSDITDNPRRKLRRQTARCAGTARSKKIRESPPPTRSRGGCDFGDTSILRIRRRQLPETSAVELSRFQPGRWEYRRTVLSGQSARPQISAVRKCADPGADISEKIGGAWPAPAWAVQQAAVFPRPAPAAS